MAEAQREKPTVPRAPFPLTAYPNGRWLKKIRGKVHFFGVWSFSDSALANDLRVDALIDAVRPAE